MDQKSCTTIVSPDPRKSLSSRESHPGVIPDYPGLSRIKTFDRRHPSRTELRRSLAGMLVLLGSLGYVLSAVGLHGLLAEMVSERTREFGIRVALGAGRRRIRTIVLKRAGLIAILGCAVGLGLSVAGSRLVEAQLFGVDGLEPWVYLASAAGLVGIVFIASVWSARLATLIEPVEALREG